MELFREKGFDATTMRAIARAAGISLGSAYHYYPSKVAIVFAYYEEVQEAHEDSAREALARTQGLRERLGAVFETKLDLVRGDRQLLGAIGATLVQPNNELSAFSVESRQFLVRSVALFDAAIEELPVDAPVRHTLAFLLWVAHLGMMLRLVHDESDDQRATRELLDRVLTLVAPLLQLASTPLARPLLGQLTDVLRDSGLLPP